MFQALNLTLFHFKILGSTRRRRGMAEKKTAHVIKCRGIKQEKLWPRGDEENNLRINLHRRYQILSQHFPKHFSIKADLIENISAWNSKQRTRGKKWPRKRQNEIMKIKFWNLEEISFSTGDPTLARYATHKKNAREKREKWQEKKLLSNFTPIFLGTTKIQFSHS